MKLVVLQCADHFALRRGWDHPNPHNVLVWDDVRPDDADDELTDEERGDEQILG